MFRDCGNNFAIPKFVIENGVEMEIYKIKDITKDEGVRFVKIESRWRKYNVGLGDSTFKVKQRSTKTITLPNGRFANSLKVGRNLISFEDKSFLDFLSVLSILSFFDIFDSFYITPNRYVYQSFLIGKPYATIVSLPLEGKVSPKATDEVSPLHYNTSPGY